MNIFFCIFITSPNPNYLPYNIMFTIKYMITNKIPIRMGFR